MGLQRLIAREADAREMYRIAGNAQTIAFSQSHSNCGLFAIGLQDRVEVYSISEIGTGSAAQSEKQISDHSLNLVSTLQTGRSVCDIAFDKGSWSKEDFAVAVSCDDHAIYLFQVRNGHVGKVQVLGGSSGHRKYINSIDLCSKPAMGHPGGAQHEYLVASVGDDKNLILWAVNGDDTRISAHPLVSPGLSVAFNGTNTDIVKVCERSGAVRLFDCRSFDDPRKIHSLLLAPSLQPRKESDGFLSNSAWLPNNETSAGRSPVAACSTDAILSVMEASTEVFELLSQYKFQQMSSVLSVCFHGSIHGLAAAATLDEGKKQTLSYIDYTRETKKNVPLPRKELGEQKVIKLSFHAQRNLLAVATASTLMLYDNTNTFHL